MTVRYRIDPGQGRFTVQGFATGMLSVFAHSPTFAVRDIAGVVGLDASAGLRNIDVDLTVRTDSLVLLDQVRPADREEIEGRMRREGLETAAFPEIVFHTLEFEAEPVDRDHYRVFLGGRLTLHGVTRPHGIEAELLIFSDALRLRGESILRMSAYQIRPVTALGGAIRLKDELSLSFDLIALPEGS